MPREFYYFVNGNKFTRRWYIGERLLPWVHRMTGIYGDKFQVE